MYIIVTLGTHIATHPPVYTSPLKQTTNQVYLNMYNVVCGLRKLSLCKLVTGAQYPPL